MKHHVLYSFWNPARCATLFSYLLGIFDSPIFSLDFVWCTGLRCAYIHSLILLLNFLMEYLFNFL